MSDVYMPGVTSRFNTDKIIEGLMKIEQIPKVRSEKDRENLQAQKSYWQDLNRRISSLRDSARQIYSFQNPFNDRIIVSSDESALTGTAVRQTTPQSKEFTVKQIAQADRFLSTPLDESFEVGAGAYTFSSGRDTVSLDYAGGSLKDFADSLTKTGKGKIEASLVTVKTGTKSLLIEAKAMGADNKLLFVSDAASDLALKAGLVEKVVPTKDVPIERDTVIDNTPLPEEPDTAAFSTASQAIAVADAPKLVSVSGPDVKNPIASLLVKAGGSASLAFPEDVAVSSGLVIKVDIATKVRATEPPPKITPPPGPSIPAAGTLSYKGITIANDPSTVPLPEWKPPEPPKRVDDMNVLAITFDDQTTLSLSPIEDSIRAKTFQFQIPDAYAGKTVDSLEIINANTHRDVTVSRIQAINPNDPASLKPKNAVSVAQDAILSMEGINIVRSSNIIDDVLPGVTLTAKKAADKPVQIAVESDKQTIKDSIITFVGNYNRLMAEINVDTRNDEKIIQELTYLPPEEQAELRKKMGIFAGDSSLTQFKNALQNAAAAPYPIAGGTAMLAQFGISTDVRMSGSSSGYDPSRLRGYLEIDEKKLDEAIETNPVALQQVFGYNTTGGTIVNSGVGYSFETLAKPYVETGGIIAIKTATIDSRIKADSKRITSLDKQLADKEATLKNQYSQMESAYKRMEQMSNSLDNFSRQNSGNR